METEEERQKNKYEKREVEICKTAKKGLHKSDFSFLVVKAIEKSMFKLWEKERCRMSHCCPFAVKYLSLI